MTRSVATKPTDAQPFPPFPPFTIAHKRVYRDSEFLNRMQSQPRLDQQPEVIARIGGAMFPAHTRRRVQQTLLCSPAPGLGCGMGVAAAAAAAGAGVGVGVASN